MMHLYSKTGLMLAMALSGWAVTQPSSANTGSRMTCTVTDAAGRVTPGPAAHANLYQTPQELIFDFFDMAFGMGQPITYHVGSLVAAGETERIFANMNFVARIQNAEPNGLSRLTVLWDDVGYSVYDWQHNRKSAVITMICKETDEP